MLEYGSPLVATCMHGWLNEALLHHPTEVMDQALRWMIPQAANSKTAGAICGVPTMDMRAIGLAASFVRHMQRMPADHPALAFICLYPPGMPIADTILLPQASHNALYLQYRLHVLQDPFPTFDTVIRSWYLEQIDANSQTAHYISRKCWHNKYGTDRCLSWMDATECNLALRWQAGTFSRNSRCPNGHQFTWRCINRCSLLDRFRPLHGMNLQLRQPLGPIPKHYNQLDLCLNAEWCLKFVTALQWLTGLIE